MKKLWILLSLIVLFIIITFYHVIAQETKINVQGREISSDFGSDITPKQYITIEAKYVKVLNVTSDDGGTVSVNHPNILIELDKKGVVSLKNLPASSVINNQPKATDISAIQQRLDENRTMLYPSGKKPREYYHGSIKEGRLEVELARAISSGANAMIRTARENLKAYWISIIDEDYEGVIKEDLPEEIKKLVDIYNHNPYEPFIQYRIHALAVRAKELGDKDSVKEIERIINNTYGKSSLKGTAIAGYAQKNAFGSGRKCYEYVANALSSVGIKVYGGSAYMAANQLAINPMVMEIKGLTAEELSCLFIGAIVVWNRNQFHLYGHISISLGNGNEVSDIVRKQITNYGTFFRVFAPLDVLDDPIGAKPVSTVKLLMFNVFLQVLKQSDQVSVDKILY